MKFYVIGTYSDRMSSILGGYETLKDAQRAIWWQGQPRGELSWRNAEKTRGETWYSGGRWPNEKTQWAVCKPGCAWGVFDPLDGSETIKVGRGAFTAEAFKRICDDAYNAQVAF